MREGARPSGRWCRTGQPQVGDDRTGAALQRDEEHERVTVLLDGGPQDAGDDRLAGGAARRAVAATHLAGDEKREERVGGPVAARRDVRRSGPGEGAFFEGEVCVEVDLGGLDLLVTE